MHLTKNNSCANATIFPLNNRPESDTGSPDVPSSLESDNGSSHNEFNEPWNCLVPWDTSNEDYEDSMEDNDENDSAVNSDDSDITAQVCEDETLHGHIIFAVVLCCDSSHSKSSVFSTYWKAN